jgi:hypothetical protein
MFFNYYSYTLSWKRKTIPWKHIYVSC